MGGIRLSQAYQAFQQLQKIQALQALLKRAQEMAQEEMALIFAEPTQAPLAKKRLSMLSPHTCAVEGAPQDTPQHPLQNLAQQIEAKRVVLINPTTEDEQDFGAYFHGYGAHGCVKGANLRFQQQVNDEDKSVTELHVRVNELYKQRVLKKLEPLQKLEGEQAKKFATSLGGRALTAALFGVEDEELEFSDTFTEDTLDRVTNIVKNGMFSEEMRKIANIEAGGLNSNDEEIEALDANVYTQMIWQRDIDKEKKLKKFGYTSDVRLYFSLDALNRGSYQYNKDLYGKKDGVVYEKRKNILDFIKSFPWDIAEARERHEVMIPHRILPQEIRGLNVRTPEMRDQLIAHFKECKMIHIDPQGKETIHGVPVEDFICVEKKISAKTVQHC